jgi:hypothetical protein
MISIMPLAKCVIVKRFSGLESEQIIQFFKNQGQAFFCDTALAKESAKTDD